MPSPPKLILCLFCLCAAAQEPSNAPTAHEQERKAYDEIYSTKRGMFSVEPNAFMVRTITGRRPGRALDVAMGQHQQPGNARPQMNPARLKLYLR